MAEDRYIEWQHFKMASRTPGMNSSKWHPVYRV